MSKARPLPLPPSGISVWKPLSSSEGGLVAILGSGPSLREYTSDEHVQCVWCGLRSRQAAACEVCGSPLYDSIAIWQPESSAQIEAPPAPVRNEPTPPPPASSTPPRAPKDSATPPDTAFKAFRRFAGLEIQWVRGDSDT